MAKSAIKTGINLAYDDSGSGLAVVLLHGFPFNRSIWSEQVSALQRDFRIITPDLRGHGESEVTAGTITMETMARDIAALLDQLQVSHTVLGGLSMGGYVALAFARLFPERLQALVLADTRAQGDTAEAKQNRAVQAEKALKEGMKPIADGMLPKLFTPETFSNRAAVVQRVNEMMLSTPPEGAAAALRGMAERQDHTTFLSHINVPTLILVGREDPITPLADSQLMHEKIAGSRLEIIEKAAHVSNLEQPEKFNDGLSEFLRRLVDGD